VKRGKKGQKENAQQIGKLLARQKGRKKGEKKKKGKGGTETINEGNTKTKDFH